MNRRQNARDISEVTEPEQRMLDHAYGFIAGLAAMGAVTVVLLLIAARPTC